MDNTIEYYNQNAEQFVQGTLSVDFAATQERFLAKLSAGTLGSCMSPAIEIICIRYGQGRSCIDCRSRS